MDLYSNIYYPLWCHHESSNIKVVLNKVIFTTIIADSDNLYKKWCSLSFGLVKYPYTNTTYVFSSDWSNTHLFLLYYHIYYIIVLLMMSETQIHLFLNYVNYPVRKLCHEY